MELKISWISLTQEHNKLVEALSSKVDKWIGTQHPAYYRALVGTHLGQFRLEPYVLLWRIVTKLYEMGNSFTVDDSILNKILEEVDASLRRETVDLDLYAVVLNLQGAPDLPPIAFPAGLCMRPITDEELTRFYGGNPALRLGDEMPTVPPNFVFVRKLTLPRVFGEREMAKFPLDPIYDDLDKCMMALASFKEVDAAVGYDGIRVEASDIVGSLSANSKYFRNQHVPWGVYNLLPEEAELLEEHAKLFAMMHSTLEIACQRLVDAGHRTKARDAIMDAMIGLESILLSDSSDKRYVGELRYRFSMNYSTLFPGERLAKFKLARDLYDLRSEIAHGGEPANARVGQKVGLREAAKIAKESLRTAITAFKGSPDNPEYLTEGYWIARHMREERETPAQRF